MNVCITLVVLSLVALLVLYLCRRPPLKQGVVSEQWLKDKVYSREGY